MFELVRKNKRIAQLVLAIIIVPFAFFGMDAYFSDGPGGQEVARVGDSRINTLDLDRAMRERQEQIRRASGGQVDSALFATREFRRAVIENLINDRVIAMYIADNRLAVTAQQLQEVIAAEEAFRVDGRFSRERYETVLANQGMSPTGFESSLAQDVRTQQVVQAIGQSAFAGDAAVRGLLDIQLEERIVSTLLIPADRFAADVQLADGAIEAHYRRNLAAYMQPARMKAEYVVLDRAAVRKGINIDVGRARAYYDANPARYGQPEERSARHILVRLAPGASEADVTAADEKAQRLLEQVRANPASFADVARQESQDPGSAGVGGDLGFFAPGAMVQAFDEAVFGRSVGEIGDLVRTDFGFHIIEVTAIKPSSIRPFDEVRDEIVEELAEQEVSRRMPLLAEQFANTVYEQPDSLAPAAEPLGLEIRRTDWMTRENAELGGFADARLINALFAPETRAAGENVPAVEVERGTMISARVAEYEDPRQLSLDEVRADIEAQLRQAEAARLARARGEEALAALREGKSVPGRWSEPFAETRGGPTLPAEAARAIFSAPVDALPTYVGASMPDGAYGVFRIDSVGKLDIGPDAPEVRTLAAQYDRLIAEQEFTAFVLALREKYGVEIRAAALEVPAN